MWYTDKKRHLAVVQVEGGVEIIIPLGCYVTIMQIELLVDVAAA